jgi:hypothetical protein
VKERKLGKGSALQKSQCKAWNDDFIYECKVNKTKRKLSDKQIFASAVCVSEGEPCFYKVQTDAAGGECFGSAECETHSAAVN